VTRRAILLIAILAIVAAGIVAWRAFFAGRGSQDVVFVSGRIEGDDSAIAPKIGGRILEIRYREGDGVRAGEVIAVLDDALIRAQVQQAEAALLDAEARAEAARAQIAVLEEQAAQSGIQSQQARSDAAGRVAQAEANLAATQASLAQQKASYGISAFNRRELTALAKQGYASEQQAVQATGTERSDAAAVAAAQRQVSAAQGAVTMAKATLANASVFGAARSSIERQIVAQQSSIASAQAQVAQARAQLAQAQVNRRDLVVRAPFDGTIVTRAAEPGEVVTAGTALVTLLNLRKVYLRGFIPEDQIGRVKLGQPARIYLDSNPNGPIDAYVLRIDPQATFTPENTYFREDRVKQVFGLKLALRSGFGYAKPGMPADGEILVSGTRWPSSRRMR
jgi:HlyD family secretion protein